MCNCGSKRSQLNQQPNANSIFEYIGKTALTVVGNITGRTYRFNRPGDLQSIDSRDAAGMTTVPVLRRR